MRIFEFVNKKEALHQMDAEMVDKAFGYIPFFDFIQEELRSTEAEIYNHGISIFSIQVSNLDTLEKAWGKVYTKHKKYFKK